MLQSNPGFQTGPAFRRQRTWFYGALLLFFGALAYWQALGFGFVWDDLPLIVDSELLRSPHAPLRVFVHNFWDVGGRNDAFRHFYRPLVTLSYWLNQQLSPGASAFHAVNILLHLACAALVFVLALDLLGEPVLAFIAGTYFALHPTHVENVAWISGRTDVLAGLFTLGALAAWRRADRGSAWWLLPASLAYLGALLSKEVALLAPLAWLAFPPRADGPGPQLSPLRRRGLAWAGAILACYLGLRLNVLGVLATNVSYPGWDVFLPALGWVLASYLRLAYSGLVTDPHYSDVQFKLMQGPKAEQGWALLLLGLAALAWCLARGGLRARSLWLALLFLLPVLSLGSFGDVLYADRFLYLPSFGFGLLLALGAAAVSRNLPLPPARREQALFGAAGLLALLMLWQVGRAAPVWADNVRLFEAASRSSPDSVLIWNNLCLAYSHDGRYAEAEQAGRRAIALDPEHGYSMHNLGVALRRQERPQDALPYLLRAAALEPQDSLFSYNLAEALAASGDLEGATAWYQRTLRLEPDNQEARHNLGFTLMQRRRYAEARRLLEQAAAEAREPARALNSLGILAALEGRREDARASFKAALAADPSFAEPRQNLERLDGQALKPKGRR